MSLVNLNLTVTEYHGPVHWRWSLTDDGGAFIADHEVTIDTKAAEYEGWINLPAYLYRHADHENRVKSEETLLAGFGTWLGKIVFGDVAAKLLSRGTPAVIRVELPAAADDLLARPFEAAHVNGQPLLLQDVSFVFTVAGEAPVTRAAPISASLRMLAVFSLPPEESPLNLRAERLMLKRLMKTLTDGGRNLAIELRVLQYGTTRRVLEEALDEDEGWDVVHFSGHGTAGELVLEKEDGTADQISSKELAELLRLGRRRIKLVTLSTCLSAAETATETLRWLGLPVDMPLVPRGNVTSGAAYQPSVARTIVRHLDCGVLAMRFSVEDRFAIEVAQSLYQKMLDRNQPLPRALQRAVAEAKKAGGHNPLSFVTPTLIGAPALGLHLKAPPAPPKGFAVPATGLFNFPIEPPHFVGRVMAMTRASAALAPHSGRTGVLFHGMAGGGKTACAVELAYLIGAANRFQDYVFWKAPDRGADIATALRDLALTFEAKLEKFAMVHVVDRANEMKNWLPRFTGLLEERGLLLVLDNLESLLTCDGNWRDDRWRLLVDALLNHRGLSRTILTSRVQPASLPAAVEVVPVHSLTLAEAVLLMRQLPNLGRLFLGAKPEYDLVVRTLRLVQGHPKLIEIAEGQASDPARLRDQVEEAEAAQIDGGASLDTFFRTGLSELTAEAFLTDLSRWTATVASTLPENSRTLFHFLCCLEERDREEYIVAQTWPLFSEYAPSRGRPFPVLVPSPNATLSEPLKSHTAKSDPSNHQLSQQEMDSVLANIKRQTAALAASLQPLTAAGLVEINEGGRKYPTIYQIHPSVAETGRQMAGEQAQKRVDEILGPFWEFFFAATYMHQLPSTGSLVISAGLGAVPYLLRQQAWDRASLLLGVVARDIHPTVLAAVIPLIDRSVTGATNSESELFVSSVRAQIYHKAGHHDEAERSMQLLLDRAIADGQWRIAFAMIRDLIELLRRTGRAKEALALIDRQREISLAEFGPWTNLAAVGDNLNLMITLGMAEEVFDAVESLRPLLSELAVPSDQEEAVNSSVVREYIFDTGRRAALLLERWQSAIDINAEVIDGIINRATTLPEQTRARFNDYSPLIRLRRFDEARALIDKCYFVFTNTTDVGGIGKCLTAFADLEDKLGHVAEARRFAERALRHKYHTNDPESFAISHNNLANYIMRGAGTPAEALAHRLAALLLRMLMSSGLLQNTIPETVIHFRRLGSDARTLAPVKFDVLCTTVEAIEGVRYREAFARLAEPQGIDADALLNYAVERAIEAAGVTR